MWLRRRRFELGRERIELGRRDGATVMVRMGLRRRRFELGRGRIQLGRGGKSWEGEMEP